MTGDYTVTFPDVPGAITEGDDEAEALRRAVDALETILATYVKDGRPLPRPRSERHRGRTVRPSAVGCMKMAIYAGMRAQRSRERPRWRADWAGNRPRSTASSTSHTRLRSSRSRRHLLHWVW